MCGRAKSTRARRVAAESVRRGAGQPEIAGRRPQPGRLGRAVHSLPPRPPRAAAAGGRLEPWTSACRRALRAARRRCAWLAAGPLLGCRRAGRGGSRAGAGRSTRRPAVVAAFVSPGRAVRARAPRRRPRRPGRRPGALGGARAWWPSPGVVAGRGVVSVDHPGGLRTSYEPVTAAVRARRPGRRRCGPGPARGRWPATARRRPACTGGCGGARPTSTRCSLLGAVRVRLLPVWGSTGPAAMPAAVAGRASPGRRGRHDDRRPGRASGDSGSGAARLAVGSCCRGRRDGKRRCSAAGERRPQSRPGRSAASRR